MATPFEGQQLGTGYIYLTQAQWLAEPYVLPKGVIGVETDTNKSKRGDGSTLYTALPYSGAAYVNNQSAAYTFALTDAGGIVSHPVGDNNARTFTIPANASVAFPIGTQIFITNEINTVSIAITTDTLKFGGAGTGTRSLAVGGTATLTKLTSTIWRIAGSAELT